MACGQAQLGIRKVTYIMKKGHIKPTDAIVISHSHWDREWYKPFQGFRFHLVQVIDDLLEMFKHDPEYHSFVMDGHTALLNDYAEIRPERVEELKERIREGRVVIGPWYNLTDINIPDGECLVRNIQFGHRLCKEWGGEPLPLNYAVDLFGHSGQMAQIFAGFGIHHGTLFRGTHGDEAGSEFVWVGPDGSEQLVFRLSDDKAYSTFWYTFRPILTNREPYDRKKIKKGLEEIIDEQTAQAATPHLLFLDGVDHATANPQTTRIIRDANRFRPDIQIKHGTWNEYISRVDAYFKRHPKVYAGLARLHNELRTPAKMGVLNTLTVDVTSSRIYLKIQNKTCEVALLKWMEPFSVIAARHGFVLPPGFIDTAWRHVLDNHPHDSICGCSVDQVARDMEARFDQARVISELAIPELLNQIGRHVDTTAVKEGELGLLAFNPSQYAREGVVRLNFETNVVDLPETFTLTDIKGKPLPMQVLRRNKLSGRVQYDRISCASHAAGATEFEIAVRLNEVPAVGSTLLRMQPGLWPVNPPKHLVSPKPNVLENDCLRVEFGSDGLLTILHKPSKRCFTDQHNFEDCGEVGDLWRHRDPVSDRIVRGAKSARVSLVVNGPLLATMRVEYELELPLGVTADRNARTAETAIQNVVSEFTLTATGKQLQVCTRIHNVTHNHRLRVIFPSDLNSDHSFALTPFDVVERPIQLRDTTGWREPESEIKPHQGFAGIGDGKHGLAVISFGLPEYAVVDDERRTLALTLLRSLPYTVGTEGEPDAECMRDLTFHYALQPFAGPWEKADLHREMEDHNLALRTVVVEPHAGGIPPRQSWLEVEGENLYVSSLRHPFGSQGDAVLRLYNPTSATVSGKIKLRMPISAVCECNLNDEPGQPLAMKNGVLSVTLAPHKIYSIRCTFFAPSSNGKNHKS
jgi:alpha-mannosidase/mannosylglycerate hydrolase